MELKATIIQKSSFFFLVLMILIFYILPSNGIQFFGNKPHRQFKADPLSCGYNIDSEIINWKKEISESSAAEEKLSIYSSLYDKVVDDMQKYAEDIKENLGAKRENENSHNKKKPPLNIIVQHWNTELFRATHNLVTYPLSKSAGDAQEKLDIDAENADMFFIFFQENKKYSEKKSNTFTNGIVNFLNKNKSDDTSDDKWTVLSKGTLGNVIGTKWHAHGIFANTQSWFGFVKQRLLNNNIITDVTPCKYSIKKVLSSEKGFVGLSFRIKGFGDIAILGTHLNQKNSAKDLQIMFNEIPKQCSSPNSEKNSLDDFDGGIIIVGDLNTRLSVKDFMKYYEYSQTNATAAASASVADKYSWLTTKLSEEISSNKRTLAWSIDPLGGAMYSGIKDVLINNGFTRVGSCYDALWSYKYSKTCQEKKTNTIKALSLLKGAWATVRAKFLFFVPVTQKSIDENLKKKLENYLPFGYLDRILVKLPKNKDISDRKVIYIEKGLQTPPCGTESDHASLTWKLNLLGVNES